MHNRFYFVISLFLSLFSLQAVALEIGFEGQLVAVGTDNVSQAPDGENEEGYSAEGRIGVFGEQKGSRFSGGFLGEIDTRKDLEDAEAEPTVVTNFLGALNVQFSPGFSWYFGDIIGGVREDNAVLPSDDFDLARRNIFATGPTLTFGLGTSSTIESKLLYINQTEEDRQIDQIVNGSITYRRDAGSANSWGLQVLDNYIDDVEDETASDTNRLAVSAFAERRRERFTYSGELGVTRYDTDEQSVSGVSARLGYTQALGPLTSWNMSFSHDLLDETLTTIDSFIEDGVGVDPGVDGIFNESRVAVGYRFVRTGTSFDIGATAAQSNYELIDDDPAIDASLEDRFQTTLFSGYQHSYNSRLRNVFALRYETQDLDNRVGNSNSIVGSATVFYRLTRSFELSLGYLFNQADGVETVNNDAGTAVVQDIDYVENRASIGITWAPPTRASRDPIIALRQLLQ